MLYSRSLSVTSFIYSVCMGFPSILFFFLNFPKVFIEFVMILLLFHVLVFWPQGMWDLGSPMRDRT